MGRFPTEIHLLTSIIVKKRQKIMVSTIIISSGLDRKKRKVN